MEDLGSWIVQTFGSPLFRPELVRILAVATPQAQQMGLQAEVGDTATFRRRQIGTPVTQIPSYLSKLHMDISIGREDQTGKWDVPYEVSPFLQGTVLACDSVTAGCLTGGNVLGW